MPCLNARVLCTLLLVFGSIVACDCGEAALENECADDVQCGLDRHCHVGKCVPRDTDGDGVPDGTDLCPDAPDPGQEDRDNDGVGDACDDDLDGDGVRNPHDNCPNVANANQDDLDRDGQGDPCDDDDDGDRVPDATDNCPRLANADQRDADHDDKGDACDDDRDGDGVRNTVDVCPDVADPLQEDADLDGTGDACDSATDSDRDGVPDPADNCPHAPNVDQANLDGDSFGDACDGDVDADGVPNDDDNCPRLANQNQADLDDDGLGDACDPDDDGDGVNDGTDNCPRLSNLDQADGDRDGVGDACDDGGVRTGLPADPLCRLKVRRPFQTRVKWQWPGTQTLATELAAYTRVMMTPVVGDLDADGHPDVAFTAYAPSSLTAIPGFLGTGALVVVDGRDGRTKWMVGPPASQGQVFLSYGSQLAIGNLDNSADHKLEIVAIRDYQETGSLYGGPIVFTSAGEIVWSCRETSNCVSYAPMRTSKVDWGGVALADLDHDGLPEIIYGATVYKRNAAGKYAILWDKHDSVASPTNASPTQGSGDNGVGPVPVIADLDLDGTPEIIAGRTALRANGSVMWDTGKRDGFAAVGNFDADDNPEVVLVSTKVTGTVVTGTVTLFQHDGRVKWGPVDLPAAAGGEVGRGGPPTIADFDGDGKPEIGIANKSLYTVFDSDGSVLWSHPTQDVSSSTTGSSVFDFEGDGFSEVVYNDEQHLRVFDGATGDVLFEAQNTSATAYEYPVIADVDADGHAEIVVASNPYCPTSPCTPTTGVAAYGSNSSTWSWVPTRKIWNQHAYSATNVHDDGSIASPAPASWLPATFDGWPVGAAGGSFRANTAQPPAGVFVPLADLQLPWTNTTPASCPNFTLRAWVDNRGAVSVPAGLRVAVYRGAVISPATQVAVRQTTVALAPGEGEELRFDVANVPAGTSVTLSVEPDASISECEFKASANTLVVPSPCGG